MTALSSTLSAPVVTEISILKHLVALRLEVSIWTARRKLTAADFGTLDLPPEKLASLGSKKVCDPEDLRIFSALKSRAIAKLDRIGIRFLGGWAIPEARVPEVVRDLTHLADAFETAKHAFLARYDEAVRRWIADNPGWEPLIAGSVVGIDTVRARLGFTWRLFKVSLPKERTVSSGTRRKDSVILDPSHSLKGEVSGLGATLFAEVSQSAREIWSKSYAGKNTISHKALSPLLAVKDKLAGLQFVDPRVAPTLQMIDTVLLSVPPRGALEGPILDRVRGLVCLLCEPSRIIAQGQALLEGADPQTFLDDLTALSRQADVEHTEPGPEPLSSLSFLSSSTSEDLLPPPEPTRVSGVDSLGLW